jgi:hypothetical protein
MPGRRRLRRAAVAVAAVSVLPYLVLKLMWLAGSTVGHTGAGATEMDDARFVAGNVVTMLLVVVAVGFVAALLRPSAAAVPAPVVLVLGAGATGLLAPILLGLPLGAVVQLAADGRVGPADDTGLAPWVFAVVYGGFALLALAMAVLVAGYVLDRWGRLLTRPPERPSYPVALAGLLGLVPFGLAMLWWGLAGPGEAGPQGMSLPAQRTVLAVTGALAVAAYAVPFLAARSRRWPRRAWLVAWTGCCVAALQAPTLVLLANEGDVRLGVALVAVVSPPGAGVYGLSLLRQRRSAIPDADSLGLYPETNPAPRVRALGPADARAGACEHAGEPAGLVLGHKWRRRRHGDATTDHRAAERPGGPAAS